MSSLNDPAQPKPEPKTVPGVKVNSTQELQQYIFSKSDDRERLSLQHATFKPNFVHILEQLLNEYGLAEQLLRQAAANPGERVGHVLEIGCGEGLYLHDVAEVFEAHEPDLIPRPSSYNKC